MLRSRPAKWATKPGLSEPHVAGQAHEADAPLLQRRDHRLLVRLARGVLRRLEHDRLDPELARRRERARARPVRHERHHRGGDAPARGRLGQRAEVGAPPRGEHRHAQRLRHSPRPRAPGTISPIG